MYAVNNEAIDIMDAVLVRFSGVSQTGDRVETAEMDITDVFYLSSHAIEKLNMILSSFPSLGSAASKRLLLNVNDLSCYDNVIADIPRKIKCVDNTVLCNNSIEVHW